MKARHRPIGRLPASPRKIWAGCLLKMAKPSVAPRSASASSPIVAGTAPRASRAATPSVIGTTCATVIQSSPSRKLTAFTNHTMPSTISARSTTRGMRPGKSWKPSGRLRTRTRAASVWPIRRHDTGSAFASSSAPRMVRKTAAARTGRRLGRDSGAQRRTPSAEPASTASTTASPAPCGVAVWCDERAFGCAKR